MENKQKILDNLEKISRQTYADMSDTSNEYDDVINKYMKKLIVDYGFSRDTAIQLTEDFVHQTSGDIEEALEFSLPWIWQGDDNEKVLAEFYKTGNLMKSYKSIWKNIQDIEFQDKVLIKKYEEKEKNKTEEKRKDIEKRIKELGTSDNEEEVSNSDNSEEIKKLEKELKTLKTWDKQNNSNSQKTQELEKKEKAEKKETKQQEPKKWESKKTEKPKSKWKIIFIAIVIFFIIWMIGKTLDPDYKSTSSSGSSTTSGRCSYEMKQAVKDEYKSPSTVKFISCRWNKSKWIYWEADAQNGFGATIRTEFLCNWDSCLIVEKGSLWR